MVCKFIMDIDIELWNPSRELQSASVKDEANCVVL